jgi:hypothetical protein
VVDLWSACVQAYLDDAVAALKSLKLQTLDEHFTLPPTSPENGALLGFTHLINDHRILLHTSPDEVSFELLSDLLDASTVTPAATQAGLPAYALLSPVMSTLEDLQALARGDVDCSRAMAALEGTLLDHSGHALWDRARRQTTNEHGVNKLFSEQT